MEDEHSNLIQNARDRLNAEQEENERRRKSADERVREGNEAKPELIPATKKAGVMDSGNILNVAAYCRVSTDMVEQETSFELQKDHFEKVILIHPNWRLAGIYADKGQVRYQYETQGQLSKTHRRLLCRKNRSDCNACSITICQKSSRLP